MFMATKENILRMFRRSKKDKSGETDYKDILYDLVADPWAANAFIDRIEDLLKDGKPLYDLVQSPYWAVIKAEIMRELVRIYQENMQTQEIMTYRANALLQNFLTRMIFRIEGSIGGYDDYAQILEDIRNIVVNHEG